MMVFRLMSCSLVLPILLTGCIADAPDADEHPAPIGEYPVNPGAIEADVIELTYPVVLQGRRFEDYVHYLDFLDEQGVGDGWITMRCLDAEGSPSYVVNHPLRSAETFARYVRPLPSLAANVKDCIEVHWR